MSVRSSMFAIVLVAAGVACGNEPATEPLAPSTSPSATEATSVDPGAEAAIVVSEPRAGDEVVTPVTISGTANVFEGTVHIVVLDADGHELAATFATATCGSGCRGTFSTELSFFVEEIQDGTILVFEPSAVDGSRLHLVSIPVVLVPGS